VCRLLWDHGWTKADNLCKMLAVLIEESRLWTHAWHYNDPKDGGDGSTDWGIFQLNDGNKGGVSPIEGPDGLPIPQPGGIKSLATVKAWAAMACDPTQAVLKARPLYEDRGFQPWAAADSRGKWKDHVPTASYALRNMLHIIFGVPLG